MIANNLSHQLIFGKQPLVAYSFNPLSIGYVLCMFNACFIFCLMLIGKLSLRATSHGPLKLRVTTNMNFPNRNTTSNGQNYFRHT